MFGQQSKQCRHDTTRRYIIAKIKKMVLDCEHVLNMINMHEAEIHGATIHKKTQISIILESLTLIFLQFTTNYVMNILSYGITKLLNELQTFEALQKDKPKKVKENVVEAKPSSFNNNKKRKNNGDGSGSEGQPKKASNGGKNKKKESKAKKEKCFYYGVE